MFDELLKTVSVDIATVRAIIQTNEQLRIIIFSSDSATKVELLENPEFNLLLNVVPDERNWQVYDRCSVVTRLYAIYEKFVKNLISDWLALLPDLVPNYSNLEKSIQQTHQQGVGRLLQELKKNRFQHLTAEKVVRGLFSGITANEKYELLPDAFLLQEQNLRKDVLEKLFTDAGIENTWKWVMNHRNIKRFLEEVRGSQNTAEGELNQLVSYRNDSAHGSGNEILGTKDLLSLGDFIDVLCQALADLVTYHVILHKTLTNRARNIGKITEWFNKPKAGVAKLKDIRLSVGNPLFLVNESISYCQLAKVESIQINDVSQDEVEIATETEVGLKFDIDGKEGLSLYVIE